MLLVVAAILSQYVIGSSRAILLPSSVNPSNLFAFQTLIWCITSMPEEEGFSDPPEKMVN